jgi:hypothetical protein
MARGDAASTTSGEPLLRGIGAFACVLAFAAVAASGYHAATSAFHDQAAGPGLVAFNVYLMPALVGTYALVEALKQAVDGENRLWHVGFALLLALGVAAAGPWLVGLAD